MAYRTTGGTPPRARKRAYTPDSYRGANRLCARIIFADVDRYGGVESLMVRWARLVMLAEPEAQPAPAPLPKGQMSLDLRGRVA